MTIDQTTFRAILGELLDENSLACRAVLSLTEIEFTESVQTACVTLAARPILRVNLRFVENHCATEAHVKALLLHEFLHILLRHTQEIRCMTRAMNLALDAVINAIIHRKMGESYSSFMSAYYARASGSAVLLRRPESADNQANCVAAGTDDAAADPHRVEACRWLTPEGFQLWHALYEGRALPDDVLELVKRLRFEQLKDLLDSGAPVFLGNHDGCEPFELDEMPTELAERLRNTAQVVGGSGILPGTTFKPGDYSVPLACDPGVRAWEKQTVGLLRRLIVHDRAGGVRESVLIRSLLPVLNSSDRRGVLRSLWNPIIVDNGWHATRFEPAGSVSIYLDVSGSMNCEIHALVRLLHRFERYLRRPFWAFANTVEPAEIRGGKLNTRSTGGTSLGCVVEHLRCTRPAKALIITDGFVEQLRHKDGASVAPTTVEVLLTPKGTPDVIKPLGWRCHRLPSLM